MPSPPSQEETDEEEDRYCKEGVAERCGSR
jgi:hypothetical protein